MGELMLKCPATNREFSTGIYVEEDGFKRHPNTVTKATCPHCRQLHTWWAKEAGCPWQASNACSRASTPVGDHLKAALYFEECAELELRPTERARLLRAARQFRWLAIAEARRSTERQAAASVRREIATHRQVR